MLSQKDDIFVFHMQRGKRRLRAISLHLWRQDQPEFWWKEKQHRTIIIGPLRQEFYLTRNSRIIWKIGTLSTPMLLWTVNGGPLPDTYLQLINKNKRWLVNT